MLKLTLILASVLFFSGCVNKELPKVEPKIIYIKPKYPKQRYLNTIKKYEINNIVIYKDRYCVTKKDLRKASNTSQLLRKQNFFYKTQVKSYNKKFYYKNKTNKTK